MHHLEAMLDGHTMYRVVVAVLSAWAAAAFLFALIGRLPFSALELLCVLLVVGVVATATHYLLKFITKAPANFDSTLITILILFFLYLPTTRVDELIGIAAVAAVAVLSKYLFAYRKLHVANPAALAAVLVGIVGLSYASWWIATPVLFPLVVIGGFLIVVKLRRVAMIFAGLLAALSTFLVVATLQGGIVSDDIAFFFLYTPVIFYLTIMVTEPLTTPGTGWLRILYAVLVGVLSNVPFAIGTIYNTPELSLVIANLVLYPFSLRRRLTLSLLEKREVARNTVEFSFRIDEFLNFLPGQYLEWTLPHTKVDSRGIRRYFTIASAPSETDIKLTVRTAESGSSFKQELQQLEVGEVVHATARAGDFVLPPHQEEQKYIFVAGGIGVTPFRSMVKEVVMQEGKLNAALFYLNKTEADIAYRELFDEAESIGLKTIYVVDDPLGDWGGEQGYITEEMVKRHAPDYRERLIYISGPPGLVRAYNILFKQLGVSQRNIKTDYFPGLA